MKLDAIQLFQPIKIAQRIDTYLAVDSGRTEGLKLEWEPQINVVRIEAVGLKKPMLVPTANVQYMIPSSIEKPPLTPKNTK